MTANMLLAAEQMRKREMMPREIGIKYTHTLPQGRSNAAVGFSQLEGDLVIVAGLAGGSGTGRLPTTRIHYNTRKRTTPVIVAGNGVFTWNNGVEFNERLYYLDGHTDSFVANFYSTPIKNTGGVSSHAAAPVPLRHSSLILQHNGIIYRLGGYASNNQLTKKAHSYNPSSNTWSSLSDMPYACNGIVGCAYEGKLYVFGGWTHPENRAVRGVQIYDIATNTWDYVDLPIGGLTWGQGSIYDRFFFYADPNVIDGKMKIYRMDIKNLQATPRTFEFDHVNNRFAGAIKIDHVDRELHLIGGCVVSPGSTNYANMLRHNTIETLDLDDLLR